VGSESLLVSRPELPFFIATFSTSLSECRGLPPYDFRFRPFFPRRARPSQEGSSCSPLGGDWVGVASLSIFPAKAFFWVVPLINGPHLDLIFTIFRFPLCFETTMFLLVVNPWTSFRDVFFIIVYASLRLDAEAFPFFEATSSCWSVSPSSAKLRSAAKPPYPPAPIGRVVSVLNILFFYSHCFSLF